VAKGKVMKNSAIVTSNSQGKEKAVGVRGGRKNNGKLHDSHESLNSFICISSAAC
jgi:hypothetical protein